MGAMTVEQVVRRLKKLVREAEAAGVVLIADASDLGAIRVMTLAQEREAEDLRTIGTVVAVRGACGGGVLPRYDANGNG